MKSSVKEKEKAEVDILEKETDLYDLVLFNDDFNTFDWVIESLVEVCKHDPLQAEQCAFIVHFKGKCTVKSADFDTLEPMHRELSNRNLTVDIL
ncbi:MAG: ATP-dependent Clp protease adaptor ClpS [Bacteroidales bacterium]|nr:ATP-dependent Clp protease adaptor ClpS [Bacteroidales bacterium]